MAHWTVNPRTDGPINTGYPSTFTGIIDDMLVNWNLQPDFTGACMIGMMASMDAVGAIALPRIGAAPRGNALVYTGGHGRQITEANHATEAATNEREFFIITLACRTKAFTWVLDLVAAEQHKLMKPENVASYFMMQTHKRVNGATILRLIEPAATAIANVRTANPAAIVNSVWMQYRTTATSTPSLVTRALEIWGGTIPNLVSAASTAALNNAVAAPWDVALAHAIPDKLVVLTHATLSAFKLLPDDWYYGSTVIARNSAAVYAGFFEAAKKIKEVGGNILAIRAAADIAALQTAIPANLLNI